MEQLVICKTVNGRYAVRPIGYAGIWNENGELQNGCNRLAEFEVEQDAVDFVRYKSSAADAVPVVRCGECQYFGKHIIWGNWCNQIMNRPMEADGFCSRGEPRTPPAE